MNSWMNYWMDEWLNEIYDVLKATNIKWLSQVTHRTYWCISSSVQFENEKNTATFISKYDDLLQKFTRSKDQSVLFQKKIG